jgi:CDP-diacylglycerol--glycerol-3-phosphate 3-phosphatidyltransferase
MPLIPKPVERGFEASLAPIVDWLVARRVHPNVLTTVGTSVLLLAAVAFGASLVRVGGGLLLLSGVFDMLDGRVARSSDLTSRFGAFYDSTLDRIGESALFCGIALFFGGGGVAPHLVVPAVGVTIAALAFSLIVSYARARAEGLGLECKVGIAQRAERILGLGVPSLVIGAGPQGLLLLSIVSLLAVVALVTVIQRIHHVYKATRTVRRATQVRRASTMLAEFQGKGK